MNSSNASHEIIKNIFKEERPWGNYRRYAYNQECTVKILTVYADQQLSKQVHQNRDELWVIIDEGLVVELDNEVINTKPGDEIVIPKNVAHRLSSRGKTGRVLEISFGFFDENDEVRLDDIYGRK